MIEQCSMLVGVGKDSTDALVIIFEDAIEAQAQANEWQSLGRFADVRVVNVNLIRKGHLAEIRKQAQEKASESSEARPDEAGLQPSDAGNAGADDSGTDVRGKEV